MNCPRYYANKTYRHMIARRSPASRDGRAASTLGLKGVDSKVRFDVLADGNTQQRQQPHFLQLHWIHILSKYSNVIAVVPRLNMTRFHCPRVFHHALSMVLR